MRCLLLLVIMALCSCQAPDPRSIHSVDPTFTPYVDKYLSLKGRKLDYDIAVGFANMMPARNGLCRSWKGTPYREVFIDRSYWQNQASESEKVQLVFHELGHCDLDRSHKDGIIPGILYPVSIMNSYSFSIPTSLQHYYFTELFDSSMLYDEGG